MADRVSTSKSAPRLCLLASVFLSALACNPDPAGRCDSSTECRAGAVCNLADHLCEAPDTCSPACDAGTTCAFGSCVPPGQPALQLQVAPNALFSPSDDEVQIAIFSDSSVVLGQVALTALALDGGLFASGMVAQGSADAGVQLTLFASGAQGAANLVATLDYTNGTDAGVQQVSSAAVPVRIDAVPPALTLSTESAPDEVDGWFPRTLDGGLFIDALIDDSDAGSGPDGGTLVLASCPNEPACSFTGALAGTIANGAGTWRFSLARTLAPAGSEGPLGFSVDAVDNAGNHTDQNGSVLVDDKAPVTGGAATVVNPDAGALGEDGQVWFPAGTKGTDVELALEASDDGVGIDVATSQLSLNSDDIDPGQSGAVPAFFPTPPDGAVHFRIDTGVTSHREGPLRYSITIADKLGHAAAPVAGQILVDDLPPVVSLAVPDYTSTISPARSAVCAANVTCGRGPAGAEDHALRDDLVTAAFTVVDCGAGVNLSTLPALSVESGGLSTGYDLPAQLDGATSPGGCANGSSNLSYGFTAQIDLATAARILDADASGDAQVVLSQIAYDNGVGNGEGTSPVPSGSGASGGVIQVSRVRWKAALGGRATGDPALLPLDPGVASAGRRLLVPVDGAAAIGAPEAVDLLESTGSLTAIPLDQGDGGVDRASGALAVGASGTIWIVGTPTTCDLGLAKCTTLWAARSGVAAAPCPAETGDITALALRDATDAGAAEVAVVGLGDAGLSSVGEIAGAFSASLDGGKLSCAHLSATARAGVSAVTGLALAQGQLFVGSAAGFYSVPLGASGDFAASSDESPFTDSANGALLALPAAPAILLQPSGASVYFPAVSSLANPAQAALREAVDGGADWSPASAGWGDLGLTVPVEHTPVFDDGGVYTVDVDGTFQLSELANGSAIETAQAFAVDDAGTGQSQLVSAPVLLAGSGASGALLVQANGLVRLVSAGPPAANGTGPSLAPATVLEVGAFAPDSRPPTPVLDTRAAGAIAYVIDGAGCAGGTGCGAATVWALQLDAPPLAASGGAWPRPGHDSCNSREAEGSCP